MVRESGSRVPTPGAVAQHISADLDRSEHPVNREDIEMAILRSADGKFYDVPDADLQKFEIPADQVKAMLGAAGGPGPGPGGGGEVQPYGYCPPFRNCFRNFRNCFRNCSAGGGGHGGGPR